MSDIKKSINNKIIYKKSKINKNDSKFSMSLHNNKLCNVCLPSDKQIDKMYLFSNKVSPSCKVTCQKSTGRCWLFAGLNMLRHNFIISKNLPLDFEFSQAYLFFWDKYERINYFFEACESTKHLNLDDQLVQHILQSPICDGGQWQMFVNLVNKYGVVPKSVYPETYHTSDSSEINMVLKKMLREYCSQIRNGIFDRDTALDTVYNILVRFMGYPVDEFIWEYKDINDKYHCVDKYFNEKLTPQIFYKNIVKANLDSYVSIIDDPRNNYDLNYSVKYLGNVIEGNEIKYFNKDINTIINLIKKSIDNNEPVWFGCDVKPFLHMEKCIMDKNIFNVENYLNINFNLNKRERLEYRDSLMTHAMLITGYNINTDGDIDRWEIENSWGPKDANCGYYTMTTDWLREYLFQISINKKYLNDNDIILSENLITKYFPPWDPMGSLAYTNYKKN